MNEAFLQYVWQHQLLDNRLVTTQGLPVIVEKPGDLNRDAGPDFYNARVTIDQVRWAGTVEVHVKSSDWAAHHHSQDKNYNNVVLHVVYEHDAEVLTEEGRQLPVIELRRFIPEVVWNNYETLINAPAPIDIACAAHLQQMPSFVLHSYLDRLTVERVQRKSETVNRLLQECKGNWEQCCYWLIAHYFGGSLNAFPFELLAKSTDIKLLARWKDNPTRIEALLMGQAGLLDECFQDDYPRQLQLDYETLRKGAKLTPISGYLWKFFRIRPSSFPTLRISQFAQLVSQSSNLFSKLLETTDAKTLICFFDVQTSPYWSTHYKFDTLSSPRTKSVGKSLACNIIINAWVPLLFEYGVQHDSQQYKDQAISILQQIAPEQNYIVKRWSSEGVVPENAAQSQALIQLYNEYCHGRNCLQCSVGYHFLKYESV